MEAAEKPDRAALWGGAAGFVILVAITWLRFSFSTALIHALVLLVFAGSFKVLVELASTFVAAIRLGSLRKAFAEVAIRKVAFLFVTAIATVAVATFLIPADLAIIVIGGSVFVSGLIFSVGLANT